MFKFLTLGAFVTLVSSQNGTILLSTHLGQVLGNKIEISPENYIYSFLGLRYANPPLNNVRFRPSTVYNTPYNGVYNATQYPCGCVQFPNGDICLSEDCLYLNVFTPKIDFNSSNLLPVMFWIHGGAFIYGSASLSYYHGENFIKVSGNVILVTINYRLGPLGLFQSEELYNEDSSYPSYGGLNSLGDQIIALQWVQENIMDFGGNPKEVTIFGESAGGLSVCMLNISPMAKGLFNKAIVHSGACTGSWGPYSLEDGLNFTKTQLLHANLPNNVTYLRELPAEELVIRLESHSHSINHFALWYWASIDGYILNDLPFNIYYKTSEVNTFNAKSFIFGFNSQDGVVGWPVFMGNHPNTNEQFKSDLKAYTNDQNIINSIYNTYYPPNNFINASVAWYALNCDVCLGCPTLNTIDTLYSNIPNGLSLYVYYFRSANTNNYLAPHGSDVPFIFDDSNDASHFIVQWNQDLSNAMINGWTNFAVNGVPSIKTDKFNVEWLSYNGNTSNVIILDNNPRMAQNFRVNYRNYSCNFWETINFDLSYNFCWNFLTPAPN